MKPNVNFDTIDWERLGKKLCFAAATGAICGVVAPPVAPVAMTARTAILLGGALGSILAEYNEHKNNKTKEKFQKAREEGYRAGVADTTAEERCRYKEYLKQCCKQSDFILAAIALGNVAAYADGNISEEDRDTIQHFIGNVQQMPYPDEIKKEIQYLIHRVLPFEEVIKYLDRINTTELEVLDDIIEEIIYMDDKVTENEDKFLMHWKAYLTNRNPTEENNESSQRFHQYRKQLTAYCKQSDFIFATIALGNGIFQNDQQITPEENIFSFFLASMEKMPFTPEIKAEIHYLIVHAPHFNEVAIYFDRLDGDRLNVLNDFMEEIIPWDMTSFFTEGRADFYHNWKIYLAYRKS